MIEYDPSRPGDLSSWLETIIDAYWNDYLAYWEIGNNPSENEFTEEQRAFHARLYKLGLATRKVLHSLNAKDARDELRELLHRMSDFEGLTGADVASLVKMLYSTEQVRDSVRIALGLEAASTLFVSADERAADLVLLIGARQLSETAASYLDRATRYTCGGSTLSAS